MSKKTANANNRKPDAAESNAGDDFHVLWAVRKVLELLSFKADGLKAVTVEGLSAKDEDTLSDDALLAVDLTEYYGGDDFDTATKVVVSQLKYSTRHPNKSWTAATICTGKKGDWKGSVVHRLADFYKDYRKDRAFTTVLKKLTIKLVSNRPAADDLQTTLADVKSLLSSAAAGIDLKTVLQQLNAASAAIIQRIAESCGLKQSEFLEFIRLLDLSDCNAGSRFTQEVHHLKAIADTGSYKTQDDLDRLYRLVHKKMMPEEKGKAVIKLTNLLYKLGGFYDLTDLFPVVARLQDHGKLIEREQLVDITNAITQTTARKILLHGAAGIGKSSLAQMIAEKLPAGSLTLLYDCYGAGAYLDSDDKRHKPENAFLQLSNQLAVSADTPLLVARHLPPDTYLLEFKRRLTLAAETVQKINPHAIVLVILDAADNSVHAANQLFEVSFVKQLASMTVPSGCYILLTSRTENVPALLLPDEFFKIEINGFSVSETGQYLERVFPSLSPEEVEEFRTLTYATPRVMAYALGMPGNTIAEKLQPLKPGGKTLDDIFRLRIKEAQRRAGNDKAIKSFLHYLILLPRPVPLSYLQSLCGLSKQMLRDIHIDLWQGLDLQNNQFSFRDQDFEDFLRASFPSDLAKRTAIAGAFLAAADSDEYASIHLGGALKHASKGQALIEIVLEGKFQKYPQDPIRIKEVVVERTTQAMQFSASVQNKLNLLKLQMVAAEAAKTNTVLEDILLNNPELASSFGNAATMQKLYFQPGNPQWFGPVHFRSAAAHSRRSDTHALAKEHFKKALDWLDHRESLSEKERQEYELTPADVSYGAEAVLRLSGAKQCANWLSAWRSDFGFGAAKALLKNLVEQGEQKALVKWLKRLSLPIEIRLLVVQTFFEQGMKPPFSLAEMAVQIEKMRRLSRASNFSMAKEIMSFCEYSAIHGLPHERIKEWLPLVGYKKPQHIPSFYDSQFSDMDHEKQAMDLMFRYSCLVAHLEGKTLEVSQFYPDKLLAEESAGYSKENERHIEERSKFNLIYKHALAVYKTRSDFLFRSASPSSLQGKLNQVIASIKGDYELGYRFERQLPYLFRFLATRLLDIAFYTKASAIVNRIENGFTIRRHSNTSLYIAMADRLSPNRTYESPVLKLLQRADISINEDTLSGSEQLEHYTKAAIIGSRISYATGQLYFNKMVRTSEEIDEEGFKQIEALSSVILSEENWHRPKLAFAFARFVEYCHEHLQRDHFPWNDAVAGIARLCPATGLAVLCRWDHRGVQEYNEHLIETLSEAVKQRYIDHVTAAALLPLVRFYGQLLVTFVEQILQAFNAKADHEKKDVFVKNFIRDFQLHFPADSQSKALHDLGKLIENGRYLTADTVAPFQAYHEQVTALMPGEKEDEREAAHYKKKHPKNSRKYSFKGVDLTSEQAVPKAIITAREGSDDGYFDAEGFYAEMRQQVKPSDYASHLSVLMHLDAELISFWSYKTSFLAALNEWDFHPDVRQWKKVSFAPFLRLHFTDFVSYGHCNASSLKEFADAFGVSAEGLSNHLFEVIPNYLDELPASALYEMLPFTSAGITKAEKETLIEWVLPRWSQKIKPDLGDGPWNEKYQPFESADETMAYFLRYFLAHPNKQTRWRAAYSLRRFARLGKTNVVGSLLPLLNCMSNGQFQDRGFWFYGLSAKLYFYVALERFAKEDIQLVLPYADAFLAELKNGTTPHVLIKEFVKSICKVIIAHNPSAYSNEDIAFINAVNTIPLTAARTKRKLIGKTRSRKRTTRFPFDTLDTIPYWYAPMAQTLGCDLDDFIRTADEFIIQQWGYIGNGYDDDPARTDKWGLTSNRHGSEPIIERLRMYFEYHALFCAAGRLWPTRVIKKAADKDEQEEGGWLTRWGLLWENFWLADFRDPLPLLPDLWRKKRTDGDWEFAIGLNDFNRVIGLDVVQQMGVIAVWSRARIYYDRDYETNSVSSVLVQPKYASALLRALQTSPNLHHELCFDNEPSHYYNQEDDRPFVMKGWIVNYGSDRQSIDDNDAFYHNIDKHRLMVGTEFQDWGQLNFSSDYRFSFRDNLEEWVTRLQVWNNQDEEQRYDRFTSDGTRLEIQVAVLLRFLQGTNQCLLIACGIKRQHDRSYTRSEYYSDYTRFYLIYPNGNVETISGNYQLGQEACARV